MEVGLFTKPSIREKKNRKERSDGIMGIRSGQTLLLVQERSPCGVGLLSLPGANFNITSPRHKAKDS
jgi:hypothetical protein